MSVSQMDIIRCEAAYKVMALVLLETVPGTGAANSPPLLVAFEVSFRIAFFSF
jgi:hypothetical protein